MKGQGWTSAAGTLLVLTILLLIADAFRQDQRHSTTFDLRDIPDFPAFTNDSLYVTMRDGVRLWTVVYVPSGPGTFGSLLERTPYTTAGALGLARKWLPLGFAVVFQDQRGSGISRGDTFKYWRYDGMDGYDTMKWIAEQPWSNGNIFPVGVSASGNAAYASLLESPVWAKAGSVDVASAYGHSSTFQGGAFRQSLSQSWLLALGYPLVLQEVKENEKFGPFWEPITLTGKEDLCDIPGVHYAGWYDIFQSLHIDTFNACQYISNAPPARGQQKIVVNPGGHCGSGEYGWSDGVIDLPEDLTIELFLKENGLSVPKQLSQKLAGVEAVTFYVLGPENAKIGNYWTTLPHWPIFSPQNFYLHSDRTLQTAPPSINNASTTYVYDPKNPVDTIGGTELFIPCGPRDQKELESRPDVITFTSQPFSAALAFVGNVTATLYVSSNALDTDFTVKLSDVYPDGRSMLLTDGILRMKWRESNVNPVLIERGVIYRINIDLWKFAYIVEPGHALRVAVSSSNSPKFTPNPNNGLLLIEGGPDVVASNTFYHDSQHQSFVTLPVVPLDRIPNNYLPK